MRLSETFTIVAIIVIATACKDLPAASFIFSPDSVEVGDTVFLTRENHSTLQLYDPLTDTWETKSPMPVGRKSIIAPVLNNLIYIPVGGGMYEGDRFPDVFVYDPACDTK